MIRPKTLNAAEVAAFNQAVKDAYQSQGVLFTRIRRDRKPHTGPHSNWPEARVVIDNEPDDQPGVAERAAPANRDG